MPQSSGAPAAAASAPSAPIATRSAVGPLDVGADADKIFFYSPADSFGAFSNFSRHAVCIAGVKYPTSEHYFQAMKFVGTSDAAVRAVTLAPSPAKAASLGRDRSNPLRRDWEAVKDQVMVDALIAKFSQHHELTELLRSTSGCFLVEHTEKDSYWGDGGDGGTRELGRNMLGHCLMEVRKVFAPLADVTIAQVGDAMARNGVAAAMAVAAAGAAGAAAAVATTVAAATAPAAAAAPVTEARQAAVSPAVGPLDVAPDAPRLLFYRAGDPFGAFSNFSHHPLCIAGTAYATSEHYFQAVKFVGTSDSDVDAVVRARTPADAARVGRDRSRPRRRDWNAVKDQVMVDALTAKFSQHPALTELLLSTAGSFLVEHTARDSYWADGGDGGTGEVGRNMLGYCLMEVRKRFAAMSGDDVLALGRRIAAAGLTSEVSVPSAATAAAASSPPAVSAAAAAASPEPAESAVRKPTARGRSRLQ